MRELLKKVGSVLLGAGALALLLVNAALTHGCAGSRAQSQAAYTGATPSPPEATGNQSKAQAKADDPCAPPPYMYATKAPIFAQPGCGQPAQQAPPQQAPPQQASPQAP